MDTQMIDSDIGGSILRIVWLIKMQGMASVSRVQVGSQNCLHRNHFPIGHDMRCHGSFRSKQQVEHRDPESVLKWSNVAISNAIGTELSVVSPSCEVVTSIVCQECSPLAATIEPVG